MSKGPKTEVQLYLSGNEILEEINGIATSLHLRVVGLSDEAKERKRTAQLIALGALWNKFLKEAKQEEVTRYVEVAEDLARRIDITPLS